MVFFESKTYDFWSNSEKKCPKSPLVAAFHHMLKPSIFCIDLVQKWKKPTWPPPSHHVNEKKLARGEHVPIRRGMPARRWARPAAAGTLARVRLLCSTPACVRCKCQLVHGCDGVCDGRNGNGRACPVMAMGSIF